MLNTILENKKLDNRKYKLIHEYEEQHTYFQDAYTYIPNLLESLWNQPRVIAKLITNSDINDVKNSLAYFFMKIFYLLLLSKII